VGIIGLPGIDLLLSTGGGNEGGGGVFNMDSLFNLRASVGLIVRAANPDACGIVDILREAVELVGVFLVLGDLGEGSAERYWSGVSVVLVLSVNPCDCLGGGCSDFAFELRVEAVTLTPASVALSE
jgi:hypothetical protein